MGQWRQANTGIQRYQRVATAVPVRISTVDPETDPATGKQFFRSAEETTANLSQGGAYMLSWEPLEAGRRVVVAIDVPGAEELQLTAQVVWTRRELRPMNSTEVKEPGYAVEFDNVSSRELACLDRLIDQLKGESLVTSQTSTPSPVPTP